MNRGRSDVGWGNSHPASPSTRLLWGTMKVVVIGLTQLLIVGTLWRDQPGGDVTRAVIAVAARICPDAGTGRARPSVADGARAIDWAVLRRAAEALGLGLPCRASAAGKPA